MTIIPFDHEYFSDELRRQLAGLFSETLRVLAERNRRARTLDMLSNGHRINSIDRHLLIALATDETEEKSSRMQATIELCKSGGLDGDNLRPLIESMEEGGQRLTVTLLPKFLASHPIDADFMAFCVSVANNSDDVGIGRRLVTALFAIDVAAPLEAYADLKLPEVGISRRLAGVLDKREAAIDS